MSLPPIDILFVYQGALVGWGAGLVLTFWIGIGSIVTKTSSASLLPSGCIPILSVNATTAATTTATLQAAFSNVTKRYQPQLHIVLLWVLKSLLLSLLHSGPSALRRLYSLSYMWYSAFSCFSVIIVGLIVSFLTGIICPI